jgi:SAM-dependent methyltransferase
VSASVRRRESCRICGKAIGHPAVWSLVPTPPANALLDPNDVTEESFPLDLMLCSFCGHLQLHDVVDPEVLFRNYTYVSPPGMQKHWAAHAELMIARFELKPDDLVVEIGSNNGDLLREYKTRGMRVCGWEPAAAIAIEADLSGINTIGQFFSAQAAKDKLVGVYEGPWPHAKLILANNVLAHIDDLDDVIEGVKTLLAPDGVFVFEVQWLHALVTKGLFDMIYHEHLDYHTVSPLVSFFRARGLVLFDVEKIGTHGGSIRCFVRQHVRAGDVVMPSVPAVIAEEEDAELFKPSTYVLFKQRVSASQQALCGWWQNVRWGALNGGGQEPTMAAYGYPAKATTLLHVLGPQIAKAIGYVVDDEPRKQGKLSPGFHIPIVAFDRLLLDPPDYLLVLAWNYADPIIDRVKIAFLQQGRRPPRCVVPLPKLEVL